MLTIYNAFDIYQRRVFACLEASGSGQLACDSGVFLQCG